MGVHAAVAAQDQVGGARHRAEVDALPGRAALDVGRVAVRLSRASANGAQDVRRASIQE